MPTYEFRCPAGHDFEKLILKISEAPAALPCPVCGESAGRRISAGGGLLFKGSGFYITDYGKDGKKDQRPAAKSSATTTSDAKGAGESKGGGESKVASDAKGSSEPKGSSDAKRGGESKRTSAAPPPSKPSGSAE